MLKVNTSEAAAGTPVALPASRMKKSIFEKLMSLTLGLVIASPMVWGNTLTPSQERAINGLQASLQVLSQNMYNKDTIQKELPQVRQNLLELQKQGIIFKFEPTALSDAQLTAQLMNYASTIRAGSKPAVAFNAWCMTTMMSECAGPGTATYQAALKREKAEARSSVATTGANSKSATP